MAALLLTTRNTPQMYYGEELGMRTTPPTRKEDVKDPIGITGWPQEKGRDGERTPMQWDTTPNAGFSTAPRTWLPVPPVARTYNVAVESKDPNSILNFYKRVIALRRREPALRDGAYVALNRSDEQVLSYLRKNPGAGDSILVVLNMSNQPKTVSFDLAAQGIAQPTARLLLAAPASKASAVALSSMQVEPFGVVIAAVR